MKKIIAFLLCITVFLCGCARTDPVMQTDPTVTSPSDTVPQNVTTETTAATTPDPIDALQVPFLLGTTQEDETIQMNRITWDIANGEISNSEPLYNQTCDSVLDVLVRHWDGGPTVYLLAKADAAAPEVQIVNPKDYMCYYGKSAYSPDNGRLYEIDSEGKLREIPLPAVPSEVYDAELLQSPPHYATTDQTVGIAAYMAYDSPTMEADIVYCTFDLAAPENAVWNTVHIPLKYAVDAYAQWNFAYGDGILYIASFQAILAVDVKSGTMTALDETNTFAPVWNLYPQATQTSDGHDEPIDIKGYWEDTLIAAFPVTAPDGTYNYFYVAVQNDSIVGAMAKHDDGILTFYNADMQEIGTDDRFQGRIAPLSIQFPRTD